MRLGHTWCLPYRVAILFRQQTTATILYLEATSHTFHLSLLAVSGFVER
jgi:hypothetical protein